MKNIVVVYQSRYGTTKQYADWIADELKADIFEKSKVNTKNLNSYDIVIYGGGLYASGISGAKLLTKVHCEQMVVFTVGLANPENTDYSEIINKNFDAEIQKKIKIFHLRGGINYKKLGIMHKTMMAALKKMTQNKPAAELTEEDNAMLETYGKKVDFTDKLMIYPLTEYVRTLL